MAPEVWVEAQLIAHPSAAFACPSSSSSAIRRKVYRCSSHLLAGESGAELGGSPRLRGGRGWEWPGVSLASLAKLSGALLRPPSPSPVPSSAAPLFASSSPFFFSRLSVALLFALSVAAAASARQLSRKRRKGAPPSLPVTCLQRLHPRLDADRISAGIPIGGQRPEGQRPAPQVWPRRDDEEAPKEPPCAQRSEADSRRDFGEEKDEKEKPPVALPGSPLASPEPAGTDLLTQLMEDRVLMLSGEIDDESASALVARLLLLANRDAKKDITLYINSPGGSISAGLAIFDAMQMIPCDVATVCHGTAASMGAFLLGAGTRGKRRCMPSSRVMIHQPLGGATGQAADIEIQAREILFLRDFLNQHLSDFTGRPAEAVAADCDRDYFMTAEEAVKYGIADEVVTTKSWPRVAKPLRPRSLKRP